MSVFDGVNGLTNVQARRGDVIGVHRSGALYDHYGVYESPECVYEYSGEPGNMENACVQTTTLKAFVKDSGGYFIRVFPERYEDFDSPRKRDLKACAALRGSSGDLLKTVAASLCAASEQAYAASYHLYTPDETIRRARSRLGERKYDLGLNNCEHYAVWCKTGLRESSQVDAVLDRLETLWIELEPKMVDPLLRKIEEGSVVSGTKSLRKLLGKAGSALGSLLRR